MSYRKLRRRAAWGGTALYAVLIAGPHSYAAGEAADDDRVQRLERRMDAILQEVEQLRDDGHVLLDVRSAADFGVGHVPGSMNIGLGGQFAMWAGSLIPLNASIVVIADTGAQIDETVVRLARVGIENVKGYLEGGVTSWRDAGLPVNTLPQVSVAELNERLANDDMQIVDVRRPAEYSSGHVPGAQNAPLASLDKSLGPLKLEKDKLTAVICAGGYRSSAAASLLQQQGFSNLLNVAGGTGAWVNAGYPVEKV